MRSTDVLPPRHQDEPVVAPIEVLDEWRLTDRHGVAVVRDGADALFVVPTADGRRARPGDGTAAAVLTAQPPRGRFELIRWHAERLNGERAVEVDQTNESIVVGDRAVVKWSLRGDTGPAADRITALAEAGFAAMPRPWAVIRWHDGDRSVLVATIVDYLDGAVDGWTWAVADARAFAAGTADLAATTASAGRLGAIAASMHTALAARGVVPAAAETARAWRDAALDELDEAVALIDGAEGARLQSARPALAARLDLLAEGAGTPLIPVHGDLHAGQFLRYGDPAEFAVTDFDGNPVLPGDERRAPQPAAVDVAGLLQSFDHVGRVVDFRTPGIDPAAVREWASAMQREFRTAYRLGSGDRGDLLDELLVPALRARQVVREYLYAARHLPHWRYVPDTALPDLLAEET